MVKNINSVLRFVGWGFIAFLSIDIVVRMLRMVHQKDILDSPLLPKYLYSYVVFYDVSQIVFLGELIVIGVIGIKRGRLVLIPIAIMAYFIIPQLALLFNELIKGLLISG